VQEAAPEQGQEPIEFDHAINYVTTIKKRFNDEQPQVTYKKFLQILHRYQEEKRSVEAVLEEVSTLFADHPDLLREFANFLPDHPAVDPNAATAPLLPVNPTERGAGQVQYRPLNASSATRGVEREAYQRLEENARRGSADKTGAKGKADAARSQGRVAANERRFFEKVKAALPTRELWNELLKCLDLYSKEVLSRNEMISLVADLFGKHTDLLEEFKEMLHQRGGAGGNSDDIWQSMPLSAIDLSQCHRCTPSYRRLPRSYPYAPASERSEVDEAVLNNLWVSVPTGSEDFSFKNMRKNQYEEALFKCEDERYEIDMVIDQNNSTIRILEPLAEEIKAIVGVESKEDGNYARFQYRLDKRTFGKVHLNAISRIYGEHGPDILELLRKWPAGAVPIILERLRQKRQEWVKARLECTKQWKDILEKNHTKSLDHRSFYFKQQDKKLLNAKALLAEIKSIAEEASKLRMQLEIKAEEETRNAELLKEDEASMEEGKAKSEDKDGDAAMGDAGAAGGDAGAGAGADGEKADVKTESGVDAAMEDAAAATGEEAKVMVEPEAEEGAVKTEGDASGEKKGEGEGAKKDEKPKKPKDTRWQPHMQLKFPNPQIHYDMMEIIAHAVEASLNPGDKVVAAAWCRNFMYRFLGLPLKWLETSGPTYVSKSRFVCCHNLPSTHTSSILVVVFMTAGTSSPLVLPSTPHTAKASWRSCGLMTRARSSSLLPWLICSLLRLTNRRARMR
jgi:paired amphipathic helix protein Sin3a